jgi:hypothetical protein
MEPTPIATFVDADAHLDECEDTWEFMPAAYRAHAPRTVSFRDNDAPDWLYSGEKADHGAGAYDFWYIDGEFYPRVIRSDQLTGTTIEKRELRDIPGRIADMDARGIATQVIFPTLFLNEISRRPEILSAVYHSYNRWLAERTAKTNGRLRWIAMIPYSTPEEGIKEMEFAKEHGACGVFKRATEVGRSTGDPFFHPFYDAASSLDLPMCTHASREWNAVAARTTSVRLGEHDHNTLAVLVAFATLLDAKIPRQFPNLRWGFVESASAWAPYLLSRSNWDKKAKAFGSGLKMADLNFYATCETHEDLPYLIKTLGGDDNLVVGTDYTHADNSSLLDAHERILSREDIDHKSALKITSDNGRALYGL